MKHTKGEWIVVNSGGKVTTERENGYIEICTLETVPLKITPEIEANAKLIAAAPDLLNALLSVMDRISQGATKMKCIAAIKKATT